MPKPIVVIVGRPNVGKSTLFNRITESHTAIIEDSPRVTRDRNYLDAEWDDKHFIVVDTGGFYPEPLDDIFLQIREQAMFAIEEADVIIHLLDGKDGLVPSDREIAQLLRASGKQVLWAVNKIDGPTRDSRLYDFYPLGVEELWPVSAATGYGYDDMMEELVSCCRRIERRRPIIRRLQLSGGRMWGNNPDQYPSQQKADDRQPCTGNNQRFHRQRLHILWEKIPVHRYRRHQEKGYGRVFS